MFPNFQRGNPPVRKLAILRGKELYVTTTGEVFDLCSVESLLSRLWEQNCLAFVQTFTDEETFPWLGDLVHSPNSKVLCTRDGVATGVRIQFGRETRWIIRSGVWGYDCTPEFIRFMNDFYKFIGVGVYPTPSSLGLAWMKSSWKEYHLKRHTTPNGFADQFIYKGGFGGRIETSHVGETFPEADYYDLCAAHTSKWGKDKPDGTAQMFKNGLVLNYKEWVAHVTIRISRELPLGCFAVRGTEKAAKVTYPTLPGIYRTTAWRGQVEDAVDAGCSVSIGEGVGWKATTNNPQIWTEDVYYARLVAKSLGREDIYDGIKRVANPAIGRHSGNSTFYHLVPGKLAKRGEVCLAGNEVALDFFVRAEEDPSGNLCSHWHGHTLSECEREVYHYALPYAERGKLIAIRTDGVIVLGGDERNQYAEKHSLEHILSRPGTWIHEYLTNLEVKRNATFKCDQFEVAPGQRRRDDRDNQNSRGEIRLVPETCY